MYLLLLCVISSDTLLVGSSATMLIGSETLISSPEPLANVNRETLVPTCSNGSCSSGQCRSENCSSDDACSSGACATHQERQQYRVYYRSYMPVVKQEGILRKMFGGGKRCRGGRCG